MESDCLWFNKAFKPFLYIIEGNYLSDVLLNKISWLLAITAQELYLVYSCFDNLFSLIKEGSIIIEWCSCVSSSEKSSLLFPF